MDLTQHVSTSALEQEAWPCFVLDPVGRFLHVNAAWDRMAAVDHGPLARDVLGTAWLEWIAGDELRAWYAEMFHRLMQGDEPSAVSHLCACNTPTRWRLFETRFVTLGAHGAPRASGMLAITNMVEHAPIGARYRLAPADASLYIGDDGCILQCSGCRRVRIEGDPSPLWVFVPELVETPREDVSHGLCAVCRDVYYRRRLASRPMGSPDTGVQ